MSEFVVRPATAEDVQYAEELSQLYAESAKARGVGIAQRQPAYLVKIMLDGKAVIAVTTNGELAGFCYIETWGHGEYVANSGLIVKPVFRSAGIGKRIKKAAFALSRHRFPDAKVFGITTNSQVMKINNELGYRPVSFPELTQDEAFWAGCQSCKNFDILQRMDRRMCLCTGMLFDPQEQPDPTHIPPTDITDWLNATEDRSRV